MAWLAPALAAAPPVSFLNEVAPLLQEHCLTCHQSSKAKGKYRLDTFDALLAPGDSGHAPVQPNRPEDSEWIRLCRATEPEDRMPQNAEPLPEVDLQRLERWIREGAHFDGKDRSAHWVEEAGPREHPSAPAKYAHPLPVTALAFSTNASELASSGFHEVLIWEPESGRLLRRLGHQPQRIAALAWHPQEPWILIAGGEPGRSGELRLVRADSGDPIRVFGTTTDVVLTAAFSPDGSRIASGGIDNSLSIFQTATGQRENRFGVCADWVMDIAWSSDGQRIALASRDRTARVLDAHSGEGTTSFTAHTGSVNALAFGTDDAKIYSAGRDQTVWRWNSNDAETKESLATFETEILALRRTSSGIVTAGADGRLRFQSFAEAKAVIQTEPEGTRLNTLAVDPTGHRVGAGGQDGAIRVWKAGQTNRLTRWAAQP